MGPGGALSGEWSVRCPGEAGEFGVTLGSTTEAGLFGTAFGPFIDGRLAVYHEASEEGFIDLVHIDEADPSELGVVASVSAKGATQPPGLIRFPDGYYLGIFRNTKRHFHADAEPVEGDWQVGDVVWNDAFAQHSPNAPAPAGWMCVGLAPLTWRVFARLEQ